MPYWLHLTLALATVSLTACHASGEDDASVGGSNAFSACPGSLSTRLSASAHAVEGRKSQGQCYKFVKQHLRSAGTSTASIDASGYGVSAYMFGVWAKKFPDELEGMGFSKLASVDLDALPRGAIIVWPRGMCQYNKTHGHIEVVEDDASSRACSDFCGAIRKKCGTPDVFVPTTCGPTTKLASADPPPNGPDPAVVASAEDDSNDTGVGIASKASTP